MSAEKDSGPSEAETVMVTIDLVAEIMAAGSRDRVHKLLKDVYWCGARQENPVLTARAQALEDALRNTTDRLGCGCGGGFGLCPRCYDVDTEARRLLEQPSRFPENGKKGGV